MDKIISMTFWLLTILSPVHGVMITMVFLILVDFITGSYASYKNKIPISSQRIGNTISKFFIYNLVILASFLLETFIVDEVPFLKIIAGFIAITEIKSILENFNKIYGVDLFKALVSLLKIGGLSETISSLSKEGKK
ncbi:phage holin family protein [Aquimarina sp. 2201CG14-23]|uniref:phage holin family protein n=1 Tax=Aquimarina mycalae TaxID=3040073 RepID=UPI00247817D9|nr:phage holin family protein [Aquimarina sp. 2201CG14-23]MDH7447691.1 phage holin family protein [Aquimarina sp. 2201CG14-23]